MIARWQLVALGVTRAMIDHALRRGLLRPIHRGVYAVGHLALPPLAPFMAAALAVGGDALVSHRSAAIVWGLLSEEGDDVELTIGAGDRGRRRDGIHVHRDGLLQAVDGTRREGIPITAPARTVLDIAPGLPGRQLERAFNVLLHGRLATRRDIAETVARYPRHPGSDQLGRLAAGELRAPAETNSDAEERFLALVRAAGLPLPECNVWIAGYEVDALWRRQRLAVEIDGYEYHSTHPTFEADHARDLALSAAGFAVLRFTRDQVVNLPELVLVSLARRLAEQEAQLGRSSLIVS